MVLHLFDQIVRILEQIMAPRFASSKVFQVQVVVSVQVQTRIFAHLNAYAELGVLRNESFGRDVQHRA